MFGGTIKMKAPPCDADVRRAVSLGAALVIMLAPLAACSGTLARAPLPEAAASQALAIVPPPFEEESEVKAQLVEITDIEDDAKRFGGRDKVGGGLERGCGHEVGEFRIRGRGKSPGSWVPGPGSPSLECFVGFVL